MRAVRAPNDPEHVVRQYETEAGLAARTAAHRDLTGLSSSEGLSDVVERLPQTLGARAPLVARRRPLVFVASA